MNSTDKISMLNGKSFISFCSAVLHQIALAEQMDIKFQTTFSNNEYSKKNYQTMQFDAIAENGINKLTGPVIFEFRYSKKTLDCSTVIRGLYNKFDKISKNNKITVVLITNQPCETPISHYYEIKNRISIVIWDQAEVENWIEEYPIDFSNSINRFDYFQAKIPKLTSTVTEQDFLTKNHNNISAIRDILKSDESFALVLGAGVSVDPGAHTWKNLLKNFENELTLKGIIIDSEKLGKRIGGSSLITAQLCKELYKTEIDYYWAIHKGLYDGSKPYNENFALYHLSRIAEICQVKKHFRILTYNYDDYLEEYLDHLGVIYNSLFDCNSTVDSRLSIYHLHGFLPRLRSKSYITERFKKSITLTEGDYNSLYNDPYSWQIASQLSFFRENICLFVGCSLSDPNIRRLLEMSGKEQRKHYAILEKDKMQPKDLLRASNHFARLGVEIIWIEDNTELPGQLKNLY